MKTQIIRATTPIALDSLRSNFPAIFAQDKHSSRSQNYAFLDTVTVLRALLAEGFNIFGARQSGSRKQDVFETTKHELVLRHVSSPSVVGDTFTEIRLLNSSGGQSNLTLGLGLFRLVCSNGMSVGSSFREEKFRHTNITLDNVIEGTFQVLKDADNLADSVRLLRETKVTRSRAISFAREAQKLRWDNPELAPNEEQLLSPRRSQDAELNLWTTMNVVQEHLIRGGDLVRSNRKTRPITNLQDTNRINRGLYALARGFV